MVDWEKAGRAEELARAFLEAYWGQGSSSGWGNPGAPKPTTDAAEQDAEAPGVEAIPPDGYEPPDVEVEDETPFVAVIDVLGGLVCFRDDYVTLNRGGGDGCF